MTTELLSARSCSLYDKVYPADAESNNGWCHIMISCKSHTVLYIITQHNSGSYHTIIGDTSDCASVFYVTRFFTWGLHTIANATVTIFQYYFSFHRGWTAITLFQQLKISWNYFKITSEDGRTSCESNWCVLCQHDATIMLFSVLRRELLGTIAFSV